ncbi:hypothetical protein AVEN_58393-1 [Araneus ventricosus]|uniref:Uncharacterized protein n=1 Tax=Araneus ventricosus TaxID=182803 RepID=A0A4Y2IB63_ARAVE|nr:hypothetical protein AVEN_58393-1 [Araneus ventricosus]
MFLLVVERGRNGLVVRCRPRDRNLAGSKPDSTEDLPCMGPVASQIMPSGQMSSVAVARKFGEGVPAQVSSSSSDRAKLRGLSLNSPRVA